jgi:hypothetical protein
MQATHFKWSKSYHLNFVVHMFAYLRGWSIHFLCCIYSAYLGCSSNMVCIFMFRKIVTIYNTLSCFKCLYNFQLLFFVVKQHLHAATVCYSVTREGEVVLESCVYNTPTFAHTVLLWGVIETTEMFCIPLLGIVCFTVHHIIPIMWYGIRTSQLRIVCGDLKVHSFV